MENDKWNEASSALLGNIGKTRRTTWKHYPKTQ
jgi:hypothetical protein